MGTQNLTTFVSGYDFASAGDRHPFGTLNTAEALRNLADRIERQEVGVSEVRVSSIAHGDDFAETEIVLRLYEQRLDS